MVGNPVTGEDFFDREDELRELTTLLERGCHVLIAAPRRIGKTSLILEAGNRLADRFVVVSVDVQSCQTEADAILKLTEAAKDHRQLRARVLDSFRNVLGALRNGIDEVGAAELSLKLREGIQPDWRAKADEILDRLVGGDQPVIIFIDELPVLVFTLMHGVERRLAPERIERARVFLSWLREASIRHRGRIRFVVSGSIGLEPLLSRAGISETMTTFTSLRIEPWTRATARAYVEDRAQRNGLRLLPGAADRLLEALGLCIPHHVALFMHFVCFEARRRATADCSSDDIGRIYDQHMLSVHGHVDLATYEDRLNRVVPHETLPAALELLTEAAVVGRLTSPAAMSILAQQGLGTMEAAEHLRLLLGVFEHDGYLRRSGDDYTFASHLLRDWWCHRFGFGYVPAAQRPGGPQ